MTLMDKFRSKSGTAVKSKRICIIVLIVISLIAGVFALFYSAMILSVIQKRIPAETRDSKDENLELKLVHVVSDIALSH